MEHFTARLRYEALHLMALVGHWLDWLDCTLYRVFRNWVV